MSSICKAIRFAVDEWKVDIITMSLGFRSMHGNIKEALNYANYKGVSVLAAASNEGGRYGIAWPARDPAVICIHAADGYGSRCSFTPSSEEGREFSVLGCAVKSYWPLHLGKGEEVLRTGTSSATPIAAALAANFLEYIGARILK